MILYSTDRAMIDHCLLCVCGGDDFFPGASAEGCAALPQK